MKTRIISGAVGVVLLIITLLLKETIVLDLVIGLIAYIASYEIVKTTRTLKSLPFAFVSASYALLSVFTSRGYIGISFSALSIVYTILLCACVLLEFERVNMLCMFTAYVMNFFVAYAFNSMIGILDANFGMFYFIIIAFCAWGSDTGAYFVGSAIGKRKLAPVLSPKKTVEGLFGGIAVNLILCIVFALIYGASVKNVEHISIWLLFPVAIIGSLVSVVGDIFASAVKRFFKIKDYGNIMPGHGGVLDRFDSMLMVTVYMSMIMQLFTLIR